MSEMNFEAGLHETSPASAYSEEALFAEAAAKLFKKCWQLIGHETDIPDPGDYLVEDVSGVSVIVMRGQDAQIRDFYNVCIHRGHELLQGKDCAKRFSNFSPLAKSQAGASF